RQAIEAFTSPPKKRSYSSTRWSAISSGRLNRRPNGHRPDLGYGTNGWSLATATEMLSHSINEAEPESGRPRFMTDPCEELVRTTPPCTSARSTATSSHSVHDFASSAAPHLDRRRRWRLCNHRRGRNRSSSAPPR